MRKSGKNPTDSNALVLRVSQCMCRPLVDDSIMGQSEPDASDGVSEVSGLREDKSGGGSHSKHLPQLC